MRQRVKKNLPSKRAAFSLIELVFIIVIISILTVVALPRLSTTRDDATLTQAKMTLMAVRNAISIEKQKRMLRNDFSDITQISSGYGYHRAIFDSFDIEENEALVLNYALYACKTPNAKGCWVADSHTHYRYIMPIEGSVVFRLQHNRFTCDESHTLCRELSR